MEKTYKMSVSYEEWLRMTDRARALREKHIANECEFDNVGYKVEECYCPEEDHV